MACTKKTRNTGTYRTPWNDTDDDDDDDDDK